VLAQCAHLPSLPETLNHRFGCFGLRLPRAPLENEGRCGKGSLGLEALGLEALGLEALGLGEFVEAEESI